ncbi:MAG: hypothetical protein RQ763_02485 [Sulfurimonas sp.]|uniref:DUF6858 family protein n=1 Tax=Sulfurimonas sp. TaxID=2022749 RepID=UPI0028CEC0C7|nr:hypothetical protein [Sulfurimonas sp.]MDT8338049.1 hypothetical protein [Sulfurimonas sp.]
MKKTILMQKYPVYSLELSKEDIKVSSADEAVEYFKEKIINHPIAEFITIFDHYSHTKKLGGEMIDGLLDAKNIVFCFGQAIPTTKMLALRPRSIGICEFEDKIVIDFMEAPKEEMHTLMENWAKGLKS